MNGRIVRTQVYQYSKSGKLAAIVRQAGSYMVLSLSPDMRSITEVVNRRYVKRELLSATKYQIEAREIHTTNEKGAFVSYRLVRVLTASDTDPERWQTTASLNDLPVSPEPELTAEEKIWVGERPGNIAAGATLVALTITLTATAIYASSGTSYFVGVLALISAWFLFRFEWCRHKSGTPEKIDEVVSRKQDLRERAASVINSAKTQFENLLHEKSNWDKLSPKEFEFAISTKLQKEGFQVSLTRYSRDGGVDLEAIDPAGKPVIVQAKKYSGNVGVAVVREMIGIRESRPDRPRTIIYSLNGFSRDAKSFASNNGVELRDVKSELLSIR